MRLQAIQIILESGEEITAITKDITEDEENDITFFGISEPYDVPDDATAEQIFGNAENDGSIH